MKKFLKYLFLTASVFVISAPMTAQAAEPNISVVGESMDAGNEIGGVLPGSFKGRLNNGFVFEFEKIIPINEVSIASIERSGETVVVTLNTSGTADEKIGDVFFVAYDTEGRLRYLSEKKDALVRTGVYTWTGVDIAGGTKIRAFVWDTITMRPLCESKDE